MKEPKRQLTYTQALNEHFGGVKELSKKPLPFKCKCGSTTYPRTFIDNLGVKIQYDEPIMKIEDTYKHIKRIHNERLIHEFI